MLRVAKHIATFSAIGMLFITIADAQTPSRHSPKFSDYPAPIFRGTKPPLKLQNEDLTYRTRCRDIYKDGPNFAGHYGVQVVGCGMGCLFLLSVDFKTGRTFGLDVPSGEDLRDCFDPEKQQEEYVEDEFFFRPNSRLFVVTGKTKAYGCGALYYVENNGTMKLLKHIPSN
jgi:hypothetical protein